LPSIIRGEREKGESREYLNVEDQAFSPSNGLAPSPFPSPVSKLSLFLSLPAELTEGKGGRKEEEILVLYIP
jgi:hypothetical protein